MRHGAAAAAGPLIDTLTAQPLGAFSCQRKLRTAYSGAAFHVRRGTGALQDIGYVGDAPDWADLATFCSGTTGAIKRWYNIMGTDPYFEGPGVGGEPFIYESGAVKTISAGKESFRYNHANPDYLYTIAPDTFGLTGNPAITIAWAMSTHSSAGYAWSFGDHPWTVYCYPYSTGALVEIGAGSGGWADYTSVDHRNPHTYIWTKPAGVDITGGALEQDGVALSASASAAGAAGIVAGGNGTTIGRNEGGFSPIGLSCPIWMVWDSVLAGADLAAVRAELAAHV